MQTWRGLRTLIVTIAWASALGSTSHAANVLLVIGGASINSSESARKTQFEAWGHTVTTIQDTASQGSFDTAMAAVDVVYIPSTAAEWELLTKCKTTAKGVVCEERYSDIDMGFSTGSGWTAGHTQTEILNNTHPVTTGLSTGYVTIVTSTQDLAMMNPTKASGMTVLSKQNYADGNMLGVIDAGGALAGGGTAAGKRVRLPWGGDSFSWSSLNSNGLLIAQQAIQWAGGGASGLLLHWKLNESSGTSANDSSTNNRDGTVVGTASWIAGRRHNAFDFDGSSKIEVTNLLGNPSDFTLTCWAHIDAADSSGADGISVGDYLVLRLHNNGTSGPQGIFYAGSSTWRTVDYATTFVGRGWHHFAVTFDNAANSLKLYIDGVNVATTSTTSSVSWSGLGTKTRAGSHGNSNTAFDLNGAVDDVRVYGEALTQSEVADLYGLVGNWKLNQTSGTTATDSSPKALHGTYTNSPTLAQAGPYPGAGQYGPSFDGTNDYVNGPAATNYSFADGFSIAGWVYLDSYVDMAAVLQCGATTNACELAFSSTGQVRISGRSSGGLQTHTASSIPRGKWTHVVGTYNGSTFVVYVDGLAVSSAANAFTVVSGSGNLSLGASLEGTDQYVDGRLHDVRLYNRALVAEEVGELYGLVGRWKLTETSGTTADDASSFGSDGTYTNSPTLAQTGPYPGAGQYGLQCDGSNDYVALSNVALDMSKGFTIAAWARPTAAGSNARILEIGGGSGVNNIVLARSGTTTDLRVTLNDGSTGDTSLTASDSLPLNEWHHYVATCDSSGNGKIFRDGQQVAAGSLGTPTDALRSVNYIARSSSGSDAYYQGRLHDVRLYNRPISTADVAEIYGLIGHWKMNEGGGTTLADSSGAGANAAFNGGSPDWISGIYSNGLDFNGTTDDAITSASFAPPTTGTVAYWMRPNGTPAATQRLLGLGGDWEVRQEPSGFLAFDFGASGETGGFVSVSTPTKSGSWRHIVAMYDMADDSYAVYVDGTLDKSGVSTANLVAQSSALLSLGTRTGMTDRFSGGMDDVRIYSRKLSPWEVYQIYGLMAWYKLDETSGTAAVDATGRGQDGAYNGTPTLNVTANGAASQGTAVAFNGSNYMQATGLYEKTTSVTAAAWVRLDGVDSTGAEVVSLGDCFYLRLNSGASGVKASYYNGSSYITATASQTVLNTGWHHFAAVLDSGSTIKVYIDGVEAASTAASGTISYSGQGANMRVASHANGATTADLTGRVDDVRVFNRALKPTEIFEIYHGSRISGIKILQWAEAR